MNEKKVAALLEQLYIHVAALPWKDTTFIRGEVVQQAAKDQIVGHTTRAILLLYEDSKNDKA